MTLTEMSAASELYDGHLMDRRVVDSLRRERDRYRKRVEVLELEVKQLQHELDLVVSGYEVLR